MPGHENLGAEARALLDVISEKLTATAAAPPADEAVHRPGCTSCPICAAVTYLRDHKELSTQLAQGALLIVGALRQYLDHPPVAGNPGPTTTVQHIDIS